MKKTRSRKSRETAPLIGQISRSEKVRIRFIFYLYDVFVFGFSSVCRC
jgi:hypothetical protein